MNLDDVNRTPPRVRESKYGIAEITKAVRLHRQLAVESKAGLEAAIPVLKDALSHSSGQSAKVAAILESVWNGELCDHLAGLDTRIAQAVIAMIAARAYHGGDADPFLATLINRKEGHQS